MKITIANSEYPLRITMGALLRFKRETGRDISTLQQNDIEGLITFLYCCIASASAADNVPFELSLQNMADCLSPADLQQATTALMQQPDTSDNDEKKTTIN